MENEIKIGYTQIVQPLRITYAPHIFKERNMVRRLFRLRHTFKAPKIRFVTLYDENGNPYDCWDSLANVELRREFLDNFNKYFSQFNENNNEK